jgi:hypothetical protein
MLVDGDLRETGGRSELAKLWSRRSGYRYGTGKIMFSLWKTLQISRPIVGEKSVVPPTRIVDGPHFLF